MRTESQIRKQLKQVVYRHLQRKLRANFKRRPHTCQHNDLTAVNGEDVGVCGHSKMEEEEREGFPPGTVLCDGRAEGGVELAKNCPLWEPQASKKTIKAEFQALIESRDRGRIASEYPDVAALMWALDDQDQETNVLEILSNEDEP